MKSLKKSKYLLLAACAVAAVSFGTDAKAQTENMTATAIVLNSLTLATTSQLNFGTIAAITDNLVTADVIVSTAGVGSVATAGGTAITAIVDGTAISQANITIADGADGGTINVLINNVIDPINGGESFTLAGFVTSYNGGVDAARVAGAGWTETFDAAFGAGTNTLDIGATLSTTIGGGTVTYTDNTYAGTYDVVFSY